jgi:hypothetical protein
VSFDELEARLRTILPEEYQDSYEEVQPVSMGSAGLRYGSDGKVAWDEMWDTFCDLAMAGGPPHKGMLLEPGAPAEIEQEPDHYREVVEEICRGVNLVTELPVRPAPLPGWVRVTCPNDAMAGWLVRAIVIENVSARCDATLLDLPAGPSYRLQKEIKNVVTVIAKASHYWLGHMRAAQQREIDQLFAAMAVESPLVQPALVGDDLQARAIGEKIHEATGLTASQSQYPNWFGVECLDVRAAIWMMRMMVASNVLSRREGTAVFVPVNPVADPDGDTVVRCLSRAHGFAIARAIV